MSGIQCLRKTLNNHYCDTSNYLEEKNAVLMQTAGNVVACGTGVLILGCEFIKCHDDPRLDPDEGPAEEMEFTWLGTLQYIHIKKGTPHYFRVPRVVLISRQFVLSTAVDAARVPKGYALGNVAFGEYERDEEECGITPAMLVSGAKCEGAALLVPVADVLLHPEYKSGGHSIALLKLITPVKSNYMLPVCLPFKNFIVTKNVTQTQLLFHVDFSSDVPRDIIEEEKEIVRILVLPRELCHKYSSKSDQLSTERNRLMCTSGCGMHSGAPTLVHEHTGHWSIVSLSQGLSPCTDPLRSDNAVPPPPQHILLYPYVPWITETISGKAVGAFDQDDPFGYIMPRAISRTHFPEGSLETFRGKVTWAGHWWLSGIRCFDRGLAADDIYKFYHEMFQVNPNEYTNLAYYLEIHAANKAKIVCVKVGLPYKVGNPVAWEIDTSKVKIRVPILGFSGIYRFQIEAWACNATSHFEAYDETPAGEEVPRDQINTDEDYPEETP